jgi:nucleotide-binding universal stress UspA family protein
LKIQGKTRSPELGVIRLTINGDRVHRLSPVEHVKLRHTVPRRCAVTTLEQTATAVSIKDIVFATDFSDASEAALPYVAAFSSKYAAMTHVAHVLPEVTFLRPGSPNALMVDSIYEDAHSSAQIKINKLSKRLKSVPHRTYLKHGRIADAMQELVGEQNVQLLIAGTHGRTGLGKLVMGSVAEQILRQVTCPTLTVGPRVGKDQQRSRDTGVPENGVRIREILYATDFRNASDEAMGYAISLATEFEAHLALLHVIEDYGEHLHEKPGPVERSLRKLEALIPPYAELPHGVETLAQFGTAAESILQTAVEREADLVILGARPTNGHLASTSHLARNVAYRVIVGASCPVLTVRN